LLIREIKDARDVGSGCSAAGKHIPYQSSVETMNDEEESKRRRQQLQ
jgi:hypothetical protein